MPEWISRRDFDEFTRTGFTGPLNWYRCFDRNRELTAAPPATTIDVPALFIGVRPMPPWPTPRDTEPERSSPASTSR